MRNNDKCILQLGDDLSPLIKARFEDEEFFSGNLLSLSVCGEIRWNHSDFPGHTPRMEYWLDV